MNGTKVIHLHKKSISFAKAFALPYVLLLTLILSVLSTAAVYRYSQTTRLLRYGEETVRARALADSGLEMALILMRDQDVTWYQDEERFANPVTSQSLGLTKEELGGQFKLYFEEHPNIYPTRGSFVSVRCLAESGRGQATSVATVKLTSMLTNFLMLSNGDLGQSARADSSTKGPVFVNANGDSGNFRLWHDTNFTNSQDASDASVVGDLQIEGDVKAVGQVFVQNKDHRAGNSQPPLILSGEYDPQTIVHNDMASGPPVGSIEITDTLHIEPNVELNVRVPEIDEVLDKARQIGAQVVDISSYRNGVLAEFVDGQLIISEVRKKRVGYLYDKDIFLEHEDAFTGLSSRNHRNPDRAAANNRLRHEVTWDDPFLENAPYPDDLQDDLDGVDGPELTGDRIEFKKIVRGPRIASFTLSRSSNSNVQLQTSNTNYDYGYGPKGPPVFVRGIVKGRIGLSYNVTNESLDPTYDRLEMVVLADHEAPDDSANRISSAGPGVPGGLRYHTPSLQTKPDQTGVGSRDKLLLMSRGLLSGTGTQTAFRERMRNESGEVFNFVQETDALEQSYADHYAERYGPVSFRNSVEAGYGQVRLQGVFIASEINFKKGRLDHQGSLMPRVDETVNNPGFLTEYKWNQFDRPYPAGARQGQMNVIALRMRNAMATVQTRSHLRGIFSSLGRSLEARFGNKQYNYQWRDIDPEELAEIGMPLTIVLCSFQRL